MKSIFLLPLCIGFSTASHAAVVAQYNFNSPASPGALNLASSDVDTGSTAGNVIAGSGAVLARSDSGVDAATGISFVAVTRYHRHKFTDGSGYQ